VSIVKRHDEKGIALALSILALLLLSGIAIGMMYMSSTETTVNANFKAEEREYFAARAGVEEVRDRMLPKNPNTINGYIPDPITGAVACANTADCLLPTTMLGNTTLSASVNPTLQVVYILQSGITMSDVTSFSANSKCPSTQSTSCLVDDELCHDFPSYFGTTTNNVRCTSLPTGNWYSTPSGSSVSLPYISVVPSAYALDWKWVRVTLKSNNSSIAYSVDSTMPANGLVCWNGTSEVVAPAGTAVAPANNSPCGNLNPYANPVYIVTALGVNPSGARRIVQQEISQTPANQPSGMFSTGTGCDSLKMAGGATTYSFTSASEGTPTVPTLANGIAQSSGGDVGANGNVDISGNGTTVNGITMTNEHASQGPCNQNNGVSGNGNPGTIGNIPTYPAAYAPTVPAVPNPMPPTNSCDSSNSYCNGGNPLTPGAYGNVSVSGSATLTLTGGTTTPFVPAVYTFNSLSVQGTLQVNGPVIINIAYQGSGSAIDFTGGTFVNNTYLANDLVINYCCSGNVKISGGADAFAVVNAPNASVTLTGGSNFYGQIVGNTIDDQGGTNFYWDKSSNISPVTAPYYEVTLRELSY
jgi:Tfp pilus assembly protein PilX